MMSEMSEMTEEDVKKAKRALISEGSKKGFEGERLDAYVFGRLRKMGWKPKREK